MEKSSPLIFDVSSDEEAGFDGGGQFGDRDDCEWLSELLVIVGGNQKGKDDFRDDVVLVCESSSKKPRLEPSMPPDKVPGDESDGDDCVVLDGDPDKPVAVAATAKGYGDGGGGGGSDDDDVEIVSEKGEVACRDFPHARHLCVKFLFASTPPQVHCTQCHCYVCDSLAPCSLWGTGVSSVDHCHATDKDEYWKTERERMKTGNKPVPPVSISNITSPQAGLCFQPTQVPSLPQPVFLPVPSQPVFLSVPSQPVSAFRPVPVYRPPSQLIPVQSMSNVSKRTEMVRATLPNNFHYGSRPSVNPLKRRMLQQMTGPYSFHPVQQINSPNGLNLSHQSYLPSHPQVYSGPYSIQTPFPLPSHVSGTSLMSTRPLPTHVASQPAAAPHVFQPISYTPPHTVGSQPNSRNSVMSSIHCPGSKLQNTNQLFQPQPLSYPSSSRFDNLRSNFPQVNHSQNSTMDSIPDDFGIAWGSQPQGVETTLNLQNGTGTVYYNSNHLQNGVVVADNHLSLANDAGSQFPESVPHDGLDFMFDNWMFDDLPLTGVVEFPESPLWNNAYSSEPASVDTSNLFDF